MNESEYQARQKLNDVFMRRALWVWLYQQRLDAKALKNSVPPLAPDDDEVIADLRRILLPSRHWWQRLFE